MNYRLCTCVVKPRDPFRSIRANPGSTVSATCTVLYRLRTKLARGRGRTHGHRRARELPVRCGRRFSGLGVLVAHRRVQLDAHVGQALVDFLHHLVGLGEASLIGAATIISADSEVAASVLGVDVAAKKLAIFTISAVYASVAGSLLALFNGLVTPDLAGFIRSIELVAMVVLGGMGSIVGSLVGAAVLVVLPQALTFFHEYEQALLGLIVMVFMIFLRHGIVPSLATAFARRKK